jgi:hypothetical protein
MRRLCFALLVSVLALGAQPAGDWALTNFAQRLELEISNPAAHAVQSLVVIPVQPAAQVAPRFPGALAIAVLVNPTPGRYPVTIVPSQADDLDGDGTPDEFVFPVRLNAGETRRAHIYYSTVLRDSIAYPKKVHAQHSYGYNHNTVALESELIGYRTYGGFFLDIQARAEGQPGLYNSLVGYFGAGRPSMAGRDVLHIGDTLGLGGIFLRSGDNVYRPPFNVADYAHKPRGAVEPRYRVIADGPVRAVVEAKLEEWTIGEDSVRLTALYSIAADTEHVDCRFRVAPLRVAAERVYEVGTGIRYLPELKLGHADGRLMLSGTQTPQIGPIALALFYDSKQAAPIEPLVTKEDRNAAIIFAGRLAAGRVVDGRYALAGAWSGSGIQDLFGHLDEVEDQARAEVKISNFKFTPTPAPARVEGEAN